MIAIAAAAVLLLAAGCEEEKDRQPNDGWDIPGYPTPTHPDTLMKNFEHAYTTMDPDRYRGVLRGGFRFLFNPTDVTRLSLPDSSLTYAQDVGSTMNMFSGNTFHRQDGSVVPGVVDIKFFQFDRSTAWVDEGPASSFPNSKSALFSVEMNIARDSNATTLVIHGQQRFYVAAHDTVINSETVPWYQVVGQRDLTSIAGAPGKASASKTWGELKYVFRN